MSTALWRAKTLLQTGGGTSEVGKKGVMITLFVFLGFV